MDKIVVILQSRTLQVMSTTEPHLRWMGSRKVLFEIDSYKRQNIRPKGTIKSSNFTNEDNNVCDLPQILNLYYRQNSGWDSIS